jgi:hypothetical protein
LDDGRTPLGDEDEIIELFPGKFPRFIKKDTQDANNITPEVNRQIENHPNAFCPGLFRVLNPGVI